MNKEKLMGKIWELDKHVTPKSFKPDGAMVMDNLVSLKEASNIIEDFFEKEAVMVPDFVSKWYENNKNNLESNIKAFYLRVEHESYISPERERLKNWFNNPKNKPIETLLNMRNGYKIQEAKYTARLKILGYGIASHLRSQASSPTERMESLELGGRYVHEDHRHLSEFTREELESLGLWDNKQWEIKEV